MPSALVYSGQTISCVASPIRRSNDLQDVGEFLGYDIEASFCVADLTALPAVRDTVTIDSVNYYVEQRDSDSHVCRLTLRRRE